MITRNTARKAVVCFSLATGLLGAVTPLQAATETVLYSFTGDSGKDPQDSLIRDGAGNLYGTTEAGGSGNFGTVFRLAPGGNESVLLSFDYDHGAFPFGRLLADKASNLYGTTQQGGTGISGVVFKLAPDGTQTVLHDFVGQTGSDGAYPVDCLIMDRKGDLYGTTEQGGTSDIKHRLQSLQKTEQKPCSIPSAMPKRQFPLRQPDRRQEYRSDFYGTTMLGGALGAGAVFKLSKKGAETVLHSFSGGTDGSYPVASLVMDGTGNLFGTTLEGGSGFGTVVRLTPDGIETVLHQFGGAGDGAPPACALIMDRKGQSLWHHGRWRRAERRNSVQAFHAREGDGRSLSFAA